MRWPGQDQLEAELEALVAAGKRREVVAACVELATIGDGYEVHGLEGVLDVLHRWLLGGQADLVGAADVADGIATREATGYAAPLGSTPTSYGPTARATVALLACRAALAQPIDLEELAYNALSAVSDGKSPTDDDIAMAIDVLHRA